MGEKFRKVSHTDALRMARLQSQLDLINARRELLQLQFATINQQAVELGKELKAILARNGHADVEVSAVCPEDTDSAEAGTLLGQDGKPIPIEEAPAKEATKEPEKKSKVRPS